jgi:thioredoxin 1
MAELKITNSNFKKEVLESDKPVLIDFWAPWCMPCRMMSPVIEQLANEYEGKAKVGKVNVDEELELARAFNVMSIPMIAVIKDGKVVQSVVGARPKSELEEMLR